MEKHSPYYAEIASALRARSTAMDPRHIEAYMRLEHPTLDGLSAVDFAHEITIAIACIAEAGEGCAESLAQSYGL